MKIDDDLKELAIVVYAFIWLVISLLFVIAEPPRVFPDWVSPSANAILLIVFLLIIVQTVWAWWKSIPILIKWWSSDPIESEESGLNKEQRIAYTSISAIALIFTGGTSIICAISAPGAVTATSAGILFSLIGGLAMFVGLVVVANSSAALYKWNIEYERKRKDREGNAE